MNARRLALPAALLLAAALLPAQSEKERMRSLPPQHRAWLAEEVVYIISKVEREAFLQLDADVEREQFIQAFWRQRDPNPGTPENEFQTEHYRRIQYANKWFGLESPGPGWRTDMGRIYIQLGEPKSIERLENKTELRPTVIWYYQGLMEYGLPNAFSVIFFKMDYTGDYQLYTPVRFGPQYLMNNYTGDMTNYQEGYMQLQGIEPALADLSLSLIAGESTGYSPSMASELLINTKIPQAPVKKVKTLYAEKMLRYRNVVEMEYSANFIESAKLAKVIYDARSGMHFVHYLIEPKTLSFESHQGKYATTLEVFASVSDLEGRPVFQVSKRVPIELSEERLARVRDKLFSFQDMFPLVPGKYRLAVLLKNTVSREFTSMEETLEVVAGGAPRIGALLLANRALENPAYRGQSKPFLLDDLQLVPSPRNDFMAGDTLTAFCQLAGIGEELRQRGALRFELLQDAVVVRSQERRLGESPRLPNVVAAFPLNGLAVAHYTLRATLLSASGQALASEEVPCYISPLLTLPRPWVLSLPLPSTTDPQYWNDLGNQYLSLKRLPQAREALERAYHLAPQVARFGLDFSRLLLETQDFRQAKAIAAHAVASLKRNEFLLPLAQAAQALGETAEAIDAYQRHIGHAGASVSVLNSLGECWLAAGDAGKAAEAWEKSLLIDAKQEALRRRLAELAKEKTP